MGYCVVLLYIVLLLPSEGDEMREEKREKEHGDFHRPRSTSQPHTT